MLQTIESINNVVNNFIWGVPAMICIIGVGLYLSLRTGFVQIRKFPYALKTTLGRIFKKKEASDGSMTPFQAVCTALAGTVGTGNIAGVAGAIAIGGPGAVFWMWVSALLGMCTKFTEVTLAVHFRERNRHGDYVGGPMYYIKNGLGKNWRFLAVLYSAFGVLTVFGTGNATQVNTITTAIDTALINFNVIRVFHRQTESNPWNCDHAAGWYGTAGRYQANRKCFREAGALYGIVLYCTCIGCCDLKYRKSSGSFP